MLLIKSLLVALLLSISSLVNSETVHLASLNWPPYSGESLPEQGACVVVAKAAFAAMGHELKVAFFPWSRATQMVGQGKSKYAGYFPEYIHESEQLVFSNSAGSGPLGLIESKDKPIHFDHVDELSQYKIGIVQDYVNTERFDQLVAQGKINVQRVMTDEMNIFKVANKRIDAAVIDINVFKYIIADDHKYHAIRKKINIHQQLLANKALYIAFKADANGKKWLDIYNQGLAKIDVNVLMKNYFMALKTREASRVIK